MRKRGDLMIKQASSLALLILITLLSPLMHDNINGASLDSTWTNIIVDHDGGGDYISIQDAINNSLNGDIIIIKNGTYIEPVNITRAITIIGESKENVIISGRSWDQNIIINSDNVRVSNITVNNGTNGIKINYKENITIDNIWIQNMRTNPEVYISGYGIYVNGENVSLSKCNINNTLYGIALIGDTSSYHYNTINNNTIKNTINAIICGDIYNINGNINAFPISEVAYNIITGGSIYISGNSIVYMHNNQIMDTFQGIISQPLDEGLIFIDHNVLINCTETGIENMQLYRNFHVTSTYINHNIITDSAIGINIKRTNIYVANSIINNTDTAIVVPSFINNNITIINNSINIAQCGINLNANENINIHENYINNCTNYGIWLYYSKNCRIIGNTIVNNNIGVMTQGTESNTFGMNYFIENLVQVDTDSFDRWYLTYPNGGNYWSDYSGRDIKKGAQQSIDGSDGFGDIPYIIGNPTRRDIYPIFIDTIPPTADAGDDSIIDQGSVYHFDSTRSYDDQLIHRVLWEWEYDGDLIIRDLKEFDFQFNIPGLFSVNLTVFDYPGNSDNDTVKITVIDQTPPIPVTQGDIIVDQGTFVDFNGSSSTDNGFISNYTWSFTYNNQFIHLFGPRPNFFFLKPGVYNIHLKVTDEADNFATVTFTVDVIDIEKPIANAGPDIQIQNGYEATLDGNGSSDNGLITEYNWSFFYQDEMIYLTGETVKFTFYAPGTYEILLNVTDQYGNFNSDIIIVDVIDTIDPIAIITGSLSVEEGFPCSLSGTDSTDNGIIIKYVWKFSDISEIIIEDSGLNYIFNRTGFHDVTLTVYDEWNNSGSTNVTVRVLDITPPTADAGEDITIPIGEKVIFNGSGSSDNGMITLYEWSFMYGGEEKTFIEELFEFQFNIPGLYQVTLSVIDEFDNYDDDTFILNVTDVGWISGVVVDDKGNPISGAIVKMTDLEGHEYTTTTSFNGSFVIEVKQSKINYEISMKGYESIIGSIQSRALKTIEIDQSDTVLVKEEETNGIFIIIFIIVGIIVVIVISFLIIYFTISKNKSMEPTDSSSIDNTYKCESNQDKIIYTTTSSQFDTEVKPIPELENPFEEYSLPEE